MHVARNMRHFPILEKLNFILFYHLPWIISVMPDRIPREGRRVSRHFRAFWGWGWPCTPEGCVGVLIRCTQFHRGLLLFLLSQLSTDGAHFHPTILILPIPSLQSRILLVTSVIYPCFRINFEWIDLGQPKRTCFSLKVQLTSFSATEYRTQLFYPSKAR